MTKKEMKIENRLSKDKLSNCKDQAFEAAEQKLDLDDHKSEEADDEFIMIKEFEETKELKS